MKKISIYLLILAVLLILFFVLSPKNVSTLGEKYESQTNNYSIKYPSGYALNESHSYQVSPTKIINGVRFNIAPTLASSTNLAQDTFLSVETVDSATCTADLFLNSPNSAIKFKDRGVSYSIASSSGAGAGNRYEEYVYAIPTSRPCTAVRYFIHFVALENYPVEMGIKEFNRQNLFAEFDLIRRSLRVQ